MDFSWVEILKYAGFAGATIIFFIWRDFRREDVLLKRIAALEEYQKLTLETLVKDSTAALANCSEFIKWVGHIIEHLVRNCPQLRNQDGCDKPNVIE